MPVSTVLILTMLCLSGLELYSRLVPLHFALYGHENYVLER